MTKASAKGNVYSRHMASIEAERKAKREAKAGSKGNGKTESKSNVKSLENNIVFEDINKNYAWSKYGDFKVVVAKKNGYINATQMCNVFSRKYSNWFKNDSAKEFIKCACRDYSLDTWCTKTVTGGQMVEIRGTYVHPIIITHIAYWLSPSFQVKVVTWIEEWKKSSVENQVEYYDALSNMTIFSNDNKEAVIQHALHNKLKGEMEAKTLAGNIDLLTNKYLIEIKSYDDWKNGLGQLISYGHYHADKQKILYLFDVNKQPLSVIKEICRANDIRLKVYD